MRILWMLAFALAAPAAHSQQVYKCVQGKEVAYQSEPCEGGQAAKTWSAQQYQPPPESEIRRVQESVRATARRDAELRGYGQPRPSGTVMPSAQSGTYCEQAKQARDQQLRALGKAGRNIEIRRAYDAQARAACS